MGAGTDTNLNHSPLLSHASQQRAGLEMNQQTYGMLASEAIAFPTAMLALKSLLLVSLSFSGID